MSENEKNLVSVIIPTYNREKTIARSIQSVQSQTYPVFEIIIIDDHSNDKTQNIVENLQQADGRIRYILHEKNLGAQTARNSGILSARGTWIAFLDSDDEWLPHKIEKELTVAHEKGVLVVHCEGYVSERGHEELNELKIRPLSGNIYRDVLKSPGPLYPALLVSKKCFDKIQNLDENIVAYQEWDTAICLAEYFEFGFVEEPLFIYHKHEGEMISKNLYRDVEGWRQIIEKHQEEIIEVAGINALKEHYFTLAQKYYSIRELDCSIHYYMELSRMSEGFVKIKYKIYIILTKLNINPNKIFVDIVSGIKLLYSQIIKSPQKSLKK